MEQQSLVSAYIQNGTHFYIANRLAGWLTHNDTGERIFVSVRKRAKHHFRIFNGWGISTELLTHLKILNVAFIVLNVDNMQSLQASPEKWLRFGIPYQRAPYEPQLILPERYMKKSQAKEVTA
jgi:hypothetical protein